MNFSSRHNRGFTLIEIMITLALGLIISGAIVQVLVSNSVTQKLNRSIASAQEGGRFAISRLRSDILMTGRYETLSPTLNRDQDIVTEADFVRNHPIVLPGDFAAFADVGSRQGADGAPDVLAVSLVAQQDCRGYKLGYLDDEEFFVVNEYFLENEQLKCRGFDGRVLRGQKVAEGHDNHTAVTLLDEVSDFQIVYGVTDRNFTNDNSARPVRYVTADQLPAMIAANGQVVAVRLAVLVKGDSEVTVDLVPTFKLLNENAEAPNEKRLFKVFETTITLRNVKNFMRSRKV